MSEPRYPNETAAYRAARDALLAEEQALLDKTKAVAELRRQLPLGGRVEQDYEFVWASGEKLGRTVRLSDLFGDKDTLLLYSFMYGPRWDNPCPSCTSIVDAFDRTAYSVTRDAAFAVIGKAPAEKIDAWAKQRGWSQIDLVSGFESTYQADYRCQGDSDNRQHPKMNVFKKENGEIYHFWGTELPTNDIDMVWPYWNLMDLTPAGRPNRPNPPQDFRSKFLEENY